ncbi:hypothetical protein Moror_15099 [Moniliophthora roreri MCA 2997]|uniref:Heme haloperoxidase family profile domain-containing protein n=2 Tax=Moniliophthora roreri TaxID=221103 RepID=V2WZ22_MONRO|nr:hypothetical protein Moror_15099 [Moniliophthora roreri MCA 2997]KAI3605420.1 hypothetical protein WG66_005926 [Moniliophthora roreri]
MKLQLPFASLAVALTFATSIGAGVVHSRDDDVEPHDRIDWSQHQFQPPSATDLRSPCPGLNALANHGFLPRNGSNITIPVVLQAGLEGFNVHQDLLLLAAKASLLVSDLVDQFSLADIRQHGNIEHDASLSRQDRDLGNNVVFNEEIYSTLANSNPGVDYYNTTSAGLVQKARVEQSRATNPTFRNTIKEFKIRTRESALYLTVMGDPETGMAPKKFVDIFFREERLPLEEGWRINKVQSDRRTDSNLRREITQRSDWTPEPDQCPWVVLSQGGPEDPVNDGSI